jgi:hypothetical protein
MTMPNPLLLELSPRLRALCLLGRWAAHAAALAWPVLALAALLVADPPAMLRQLGAALPAGAEPAWGGPTYAHWQRWAVIAAAMVPAGLAGAALWRLGLGFAGLVQGDALPGACAALRAFAGWTVAAVVAGGLATPLSSVLLTWQHAAGQRALTVGLSSHAVHGLLTAALVYLFAHVLQRAQAVADENAQFV